MQTSVLPFALSALILAGTATIGCSAFQSDAKDYAGPGGFSNDVSELPDPNEINKPKDESAKIANSLNQYGYGQRIPESAERLWMQANTFFEQKHYHDAERVYKKYLATPEAQSATSDMLSLAHYRIGYVERKKMFFAEAAKEFKQAVQFAPQNDEYLFSYAKTSYEAKDFSTADAQFVALLNRNPSYPEAQYYYGLTLLESSNRTNALQPLTATVGELQAYALLADCYYSKGELQQAAQAEGQMLQIAARLGHEPPELPNKINTNVAVNASSASAAPSIYATPVQAPVATSMPQAIATPSPAPVAVQQPTQAQGYFAASAPLATQTAPIQRQEPAAPVNFVPTTEAVAAQPAVVAPTTENAQAFASYAPTTASVQESTAAEPAPSAPNESAFAADAPAFAPVMENAAQTPAPEELPPAPVVEAQSIPALAVNAEPVVEQTVPAAPQDAIAQAPVSAPVEAQAAPVAEQPAAPMATEGTNAGFALSATSALLQSLNEAEQQPEQTSEPTAASETAQPQVVASAPTQTPTFAPIPVAENQVFMTPAPEAPAVAQSQQPGAELAVNQGAPAEQPLAALAQSYLPQTESGARTQTLPNAPQDPTTYAQAPAAPNAIPQNVPQTQTAYAQAPIAPIAPNTIQQNAPQMQTAYAQAPIAPNAIPQNAPQTQTAFAQAPIAPNAIPQNEPQMQTAYAQAPIAPNASLQGAPQMQAQPQAVVNAPEQTYAAQEIPTPVQDVNEDDFAFATSGTPAPAAQSVPAPAAPAYVAAVPNAAVTGAVATPYASTPYVQSVPPQAQAVVQPSTQATPVPTPVQAPLPTNSLFNID